MSLSSCRDGGKRAFIVGLVLDAGGLGDKGRNDLLWRACQGFVENGTACDVRIEVRSPATAAEGEAALEELCRLKANAVVVGSPLWERRALKLSPKYPRTAFIVAGGSRGAANVKSISFPLQDVGYLMGVCAAASVPGGGFGFLGGREDAATVALARGFAAGVRSEIPTARVAVRYLGRDFEAPARAGGAGMAAREMYRDGAGVIFAAAGPGNGEIAEVANEMSKLLIGYESNQNYLERGNIITSLNLRWDEVVLQELEDVACGRFRGGRYDVPLSSELITYAVDDNNRQLIPAEAVKKIETARQSLIANATR